MSAALQKGAALPFDMERLVEVGRRHGVAVIEVAACAIRSEQLEVVDALREAVRRR